MNKLRGKVKDAVKNKEKETQLLHDNIKSIKKQLKVLKKKFELNRKRLKGMYHEIVLRTWRRSRRSTGPRAPRPGRR